MTEMIAIALPSLELTDEETAELAQLRSELRKYRKSNDLFYAYYEASSKVRDLGISIPPHLQGIDIAMGLPGTGVDVIEERLDWLGWRSSANDLMGLDEVFRDNRLAIESSDVHLDALIAGTSFVEVGEGEDNEPDTLVTPRSPKDSTIIWDARRRQARSGYTRIVNDRGVVQYEVLFTRTDTLVLEKVGRKMVVVDRITHNMGVPALVRFTNRRRGSRSWGRSEITRTVRYYTDAAVRTMLGMEVNREFYNAPQRYILGATEDSFEGADGVRKSTWETIQGRMLAIGRDEEGDLPTVGQFPSSSPQPYIEQVKLIFQLAAAELGIPASYLGFVTENPASADAIARAEIRLIKRSERRQGGFGSSWLDVADVVLRWRGDGTVDRTKFAALSNKWTPSGTPTPAAAADQTQKLITAGVLLPDSEVTYDRVGLDADEQAQLTSEKAKARSTERLALLAAARKVPTEPVFSAAS